MNKKIKLLIVLAILPAFIFAQEQFSDDWYVLDTEPKKGVWKKIDYPEGFKNRDFAQTAWTGTEYIIWHGSDSESSESEMRNNKSDGRYIPNNGFYYTDGWIINPETGNFRKMPPSGLPPLVEGYNSVWTGKYLFVWGYNSSRCKLYDYENNKWVKVTTVGAPSTRININFIWTGTEIFVFGGDLPNAYKSYNDAYLYNPETNRWRKAAANNLLSNRRSCITMWTGEEVIVWGGSGELNDGAAYNPTSNTWRSISSNPYGDGWYWSTYNLGESFLLISGNGKNACTYNYNTDMWSQNDCGFRGNTPDELAIVNTGSEIIVYGAEKPKNGVIWDYRSNSYSPVPLRSNMADEGDNEAIWTGRGLFLLNNDAAYMYFPSDDYKKVEFNPTRGTFIDSRDGTTYPTVELNGNTWMAENLNFMPDAGVARYYEDDANKNSLYGLLYDWNTAKKACPTGWRLPSDAEWIELISYAGGERYSARSLVANAPYINKVPGDNSTGFSIYLSGVYSEYDYFDGFGKKAKFWTSGESNYFEDRIEGIIVTFSPPFIYSHPTATKVGASVRCIKK